MTPQIPLPPPDRESLSFELVDRSQSLVRLSAGPNERTRGASVYVVNTASGYGTIAPSNADGSFTTLPFEANDGDQLTIDYRRGEEQSDVLCVLVSYTGGVPQACP